MFNIPEIEDETSNNIEDRIKDTVYKRLSNIFESGIFITNDRPYVSALMFVDDISTVAKLKIQINCEETGMKINLDKSKIMVFRKGGHIRQNEKWTFKGRGMVQVFRHIFHSEIMLD